MSVQRANNQTTYYDPTRNTEGAGSKKTSLAEDPDKRRRYLEEAGEKVTAAEEQWKTDPEEGIQSMKELVKKWQGVLRSEDWDNIDSEFKQGLLDQIKAARAFIKANDKPAGVESVLNDPATAPAYLKLKKTELKDIEKNWRSDPDYYGNLLVDQYTEMSPLLEPESFAKLDTKAQKDLIAHMDMVSKLGQDMMNGTSLASPEEEPEEE